MGQILIVSQKLICVIAPADSFLFTLVSVYLTFSQPLQLHSILLSGDIDLPNGIGVPQ